MTGRERLAALLAGRTADRLSWTTLVDDATLALVPAEFRGNHGLDFYKRIGCDIFLLNGWNTPFAFRSPELCWDGEVRVETRRDDGLEHTAWHTPRGTLTAIRRGAHPLKYPVRTLEEAHILRRLWEGARFVEHNDSAVLETLDGLIGDAGVVTRFWGPSTIPRLLEEDMGAEAFYYLMADHPSEMEGLIETMHRREMEAFRILARCPCDSVTLVENTSTFYISPDIYRRFNMPHQRDFVETIRAAEKTALLHMCGHVRGLLDLIRETRCDGLHALTPPPTGDTPWEVALDVLGEDMLIIGCLDPSIFISGPVAEIPLALDRLITPRLRRARFVLGPMADGIPVPLERFLAVARWCEMKMTDRR